MLHGFELQAVEDFLEYVDETFPKLNPYTSFEVCKGNIDLLNKRCRAIVANCEINGEKREVKYHRDWKYYIESGVNTVKQIALDANESKNGFTIDLWLNAGDTMNSAKETYSKLNREKLLNLQEKGFQLSNNFHVSYRSKNLEWLKNGSLSFAEYIDFWLAQYQKNNIRQIKRNEFESYFKFLENNGLISEIDLKRMEEKIFSKRYDRLNICPGFTIRYSWDGQTAIELDRENKFEKEFYEKLMEAFDAIGGL